MTVLEHGAARLGLALDASQFDRFAGFIELLQRWNARAALTADPDPEVLQRRHLLDALTLLPLLDRAGVAADGTLVDVGSGAGLPGLALAIARPGLRVTLVEATAKKVAFLEHAAARLTPHTVTIAQGRAEILGHEPAHRERYDVAVARAVAPLAVLAELLLPLVRVGGRAVALKRAAAVSTVATALTTLDEELAGGRPAAAVLGGELGEIAPGGLPEELPGHVLVVLNKTEATPDRYPRRPGVPQRRPLS